MGNRRYNRYVKLCENLRGEIALLEKMKFEGTTEVDRMTWDFTWKTPWVTDPITGLQTYTIPLGGANKLPKFPIDEAIASWKERYRKLITKEISYAEAVY